jgi:hypothetical protein
MKVLDKNTQSSKNSIPDPGMPKRRPKKEKNIKIVRSWSCISIEINI